MQTMVQAPYDATVRLMLASLERNLLPDAVIRKLTRLLLANRLRSGYKSTSELQLSDLLCFAHSLREMPIAVKTEDAKSQHYELPTSFFKLVLGEHLKYSCCLFSDKSSTLEDAEKAMLELYCKKAKLEDGPTVLDIGCGWGSLSLYNAEKYSNCKVTGICNSEAFIEEQCRNRQLENVEIIVADISIFEMEASYDRIFSIEMFEHMKNYRDLLKKISMWLKSDGLLFVHYFCHKAFAYHFEDVGEDDWVDGILMFIFDPGGGFSPQMDCDILKFDNRFQLSNGHMPLIVCDMCVMVGENNLPGVNAGFGFTAEYVSMMIKDDDSYMKRIWNDYDQIFFACEEIFFACEEILIRYSLSKACMVDLGFHQCDAYVNMLFLFAVTWYNLDIVESILLIHVICIQRYHGMYALDGRMQACTATVHSHKCDVNGYLLVLLAASSARSWVALYNIDVVLPITPSVTRGQVIQQLKFLMKAYSIMALLKVEDSARHLVDRVVITQGRKGIELFLKKPEWDSVHRLDCVFPKGSWGHFFFMEPKPRKEDGDQIMSICCIFVKSFVDKEYMIPYILEDKDVLKRKGIGIQVALRHDEWLNVASAHYNAHMELLACPLVDRELLSLLITSSKFRIEKSFSLVGPFVTIGRFFLTLFFYNCIRIDNDYGLANQISGLGSKGFNFEDTTDVNNAMRVILVMVQTKWDNNCQGPLPPDHSPAILVNTQTLMNDFDKATLFEPGYVAVTTQFKEILRVSNSMWFWRHLQGCREDYDLVTVDIWENFVWDPGLIWLCHFTTLRTRRLLRGRICHVPRLELERRPEKALVSVRLSY